MEFKKSNRLSWGVTLIVFGILFLIKRIFPLPESVVDIVFDFRNYPIYAGIVFLIFSKYKNTGIVLISIGLLLRLSQIIYLFRNISDIIWPLLLIAIGVLLIVRFNNSNK